MGTEIVSTPDQDYRIPEHQFTQDKQSRLSKRQKKTKLNDLTTDNEIKIAISSNLKNEVKKRQACGKRFTEEQIWVTIHSLSNSVLYLTNKQNKLPLRLSITQIYLTDKGDLKILNPNLISKLKIFTPYQNPVVLLGQIIIQMALMYKPRYLSTVIYNQLKDYYSDNIIQTIHHMLNNFITFKGLIKVSYEHIRAIQNQKNTTKKQTYFKLPKYTSIPNSQQQKYNQFIKPQQGISEIEDQLENNINIVSYKLKKDENLQNYITHSNLESNLIVQNKQSYQDQINREQHCFPSKLINKKKDRDLKKQKCNKKENLQRYIIFDENNYIQMTENVFLQEQGYSSSICSKNQQHNCQNKDNISQEQTLLRESYSRKQLLLSPVLNDQENQDHYEENISILSIKHNRFYQNDTIMQVQEELWQSDQSLTFHKRENNGIIQKQWSGQQNNQSQQDHKYYKINISDQEKSNK